MKQINIFRINLSFLRNKNYQEFQRLTNYLDHMTRNKGKTPSRAHVSAELYAELLTAFPDSEFRYDSVIIACSDTEMLNLIKDGKKPCQLKKKSNKKMSENFKKYIVNNPDLF